MIHDKIIKDERGTIRIEVKLWKSNFNSYEAFENCFRYDIFVWHTAPRKRTEVLNRSIATDEEILSAKLEFWNLMKPTL